MLIHKFSSQYPTQFTNCISIHAMWRRVSILCEETLQT